MAHDHDAEIAELARISVEEIYNDEALLDLYGLPPEVPALLPETLIDDEIPF